MYGHGGYGCSCGGYGCNKCYKSVCCAPKVCSKPPNVAGTWNLKLNNLSRSGTGPNVTCANIIDVTSGQPIVLVITQCGCPNDVFVTATVTSGPTGASPIVTGDQLLGVFQKDGRKCWTLKLVSPTDNTTFEMNFLAGYGYGYGASACPKQLNFSYTKPLDPSLMDFSAVGAGCGNKVA